MLSLCIIVKPTNREAELLDRCLRYVANSVDEICVTQAGDKPNKKVSAVIKDYKGKESFFKWVGDFSKARNFNFSQASNKYIFWCDTDDVVKNAYALTGLVEIMEKDKIDVAVMNYLYEFNENKECTVKHLKTRVVRKDCVEWVGKVHEDFNELRSLTSYFCPDIEILHITDKKRQEDSSERNLKIALTELENNPKDPRSYWLAANGYWGVGKIDLAVENFKKFVELSHSEEEKYLAYLNLNDLEGKEEFILKALSIRPTYPNAYFKMAEQKFKDGKYQIAIDFIEIGLQLPIPEKTLMVYNPREYDYNPLMVLAKCYWKMGRDAKAVEILKKMKSMFPNDGKVAEYFSLLKEEKGEALYAEKYLDEAKKITDKAKLKAYLDNLPKKVINHPIICSFRNENFIKEASSGKDLVFYCSYTAKEWNPEVAMKNGVGGSEEAVINLSKELVKIGWNVTVYNNCGKPKNYEGVSYRQFWEYNIRDKQDITVLWRHPKPVDYEPNSKIVIDMHDVLSDKEFTDDRLRSIDKVFVKSKAHRILFPNIPDDKIAIIPNGIDPELFKKTKKNPYLILNTSSPDRHLEATLDVFEKLIEKQPDKPWKLAWYYGWGVYDTVHINNQEMLDYKKRCVDRFDKLVASGRAEGGYMINHKEIANKYEEAGIFLYPTQFYEIDCISARKAQLAGCKVICSDFAALDETVKYGWKLHTSGIKWGKDNTFGDTENIDKYVEKIIMDTPVNGEEIEWVKENFNWKKLAKEWNNNLIKL